jgi:signal transduction histidine kinase
LAEDPAGPPRSAIRKLLRMDTDFFHNVTHELSTPLTPIVGYLKLLRKPEVGPLTEMQARAVDSMEKCAERLRTVIDDLLDVSRWEGGQVSLESRGLLVGELLREALDGLAPKAAENAVTVIESFAPDERPIHGDADKLRKAIRHVLDNAIKFTGSGGRVLVELTQIDGLTRVHFYDSGLGLPTADHEAIFEPFHQADASPTRRFGGLGVGLSVAKRIVEAHGGRLTVESPPSAQPEGHFFKGSLFTIELCE